jgi:hypothetical protein
MKLDVRHAGGELTVGSQTEFLKLYQRGVITADDLVRREGQTRWIPAGQLPGISSMREQGRKDNRQLFFITLAMMVFGLVAALWIQSHAPRIAKRAVPNGVHAVPAAQR